MPGLNGEVILSFPLDPSRLMSSQPAAPGFEGAPVWVESVSMSCSGRIFEAAFSVPPEFVHLLAPRVAALTSDAGLRLLGVGFAPWPPAEDEPDEVYRPVPASARSSSSSSSPSASLSI